MSSDGINDTTMRLMTTAPPKHRRRFLRFSLRSMLLLMMVIGVSFGWTIHKAREQGIAVVALVKKGCRVEYASHGSPTILEMVRGWLGDVEPRDVTEIDCLDSQIADIDLVHLQKLPQLQQLGLWRHASNEGLVHLQGLTELAGLYLEGSQISDKGLVNIETLRNLTDLSLEGTQVTDAGLVHIRGLDHLRYLALNDTQVTDAGLVHLQRFPQLQNLDLKGLQISDAGLIHLRGLSQLERLDLRGTQVTDAGLGMLQGLTHLHSLWLDGNKVTDAGVQELKKALPYVAIIRR